MSWEAGSLLMVGLVLAAGFLWYERSHPSSRILALVATLAALAAVARIAFAPIPNVKPTTDIVLLTGYVLGGAPGFAVGAVGAIASNVVYGQGPWTPWQMAAWGMCGLLGAGVARITHGQASRLTLVVACALAGVLYGMTLDFSSWAVLSGQHTLAQYLVITGTSLPFNIAHVVGNIAFCLVFGPAFVRALERFKARLDVTWLPLPAALAADRR